MKKTVFTLILSALAVFAMAQYPLVPIDTTQYVSPTRLANIGVGGNDSTLADYIFPTHHNPTYGDTVVVEGIVVFDPASYGLSTSQSRVSAFIQAADDRSWSGVEIMMDTAVLNPKPTKAALDAASQFSQNLKKGRMVRVTTIIGNFQGNTQLYILPVPIQVLSTGNTITAQEIEVGDVMKNVAGNPTPQFATGEQWEGTYVEIKDVFVTNVSASGQRWFWSVQDDNGNSIQIRDYSNYYRNDNNDADPNTPRNFTPPTTNTRLDYIRGVITEGVVSGQRLYFIAPLYPDDVAVPLFNAPSVKSVKRIPAVVTPSVSPTIRVNVQDDSAIASVTLYYAVGYANTTFTPVTMTGTDSIYTAQIPAQSLGSIVKYYIHAEDNGGHSVNFPDSLALTSAYKVINGIRSTSDIQKTVYSNGGSMFVNDTLRGITVPGIVVSTNASNDLGLFTLQSGTGPWSAIFVRPTVGDGVATWKRGDSIVITEAVVTERFNQGAD
ncbi:MAG TPA: hypothetical protein VEC12_05930, partial [Bacteroidia bacterium]|nr:hypothetical protein [Bacteroidia bacterium]